VVLFLAIVSPSLAPAQDEDEEDEPKKPREERDAGPTEHEKLILDKFNATSKGFENGQVVLTYNFENREENEVLDWDPIDTALNSRIHWATSGELTQLNREQGYTTQLTRYADGGMVLSDYGLWKHKAMFLSDLEVSVEVINVASPRAGTVLCSTFFSPKKKSSIGVNSGLQVVGMTGWKTTKGPWPKGDKALTRLLRQTFGYKYSNRVLESYLNNKKVADSSAAGKLTEGFDVGQVAMAWNGSIKTFVLNITIRGRLDPDWVSAQLGEKSKAEAEKKKDKPATGKVKPAEVKGH
jgi:hypothetical protein